MKRIIIFGFLAMGYQVKAQPGALDATFGDNGKAILNIANSQSRTLGLSVQPDGKTVIAGATAGAFTVARCNPDGSLDADFSGKGYDTILIGASGRAEAVTVQPDGRIIAVGTMSDGPVTPDFMTVRYNPNGQRDHTFNSTGIAVTNVGGTDYSYSVAVQADGKAVVGGSYGRIELVRFNVDGSLDNSFDGDGKLVVDLNLLNGAARQIIIQSDNKILVVGYAIPPTNSSFDFVLMRLNPDGSFDSSFGVDGIVRTDFFGAYDFAYKAHLLPDGKIIVGGYTLQPGSGDDFALAKYNSDGTLDNSFGSNGKVVADIGGQDIAKAMLIDGQNRIILAGNSDTLCALARFTADGQLDADFGQEGVAKFPVYGIDDRIEDIALLPDGKIIAAGWSKYDNNSFRSTLVRILNSGGVNVPETPLEKQINVFPNPASALAYLENTTGDNIRGVDIIGMNGQVVSHAEGKNIQQVSLENIPPGSYFFRLYLEGNKTINKPMIISR